MVFKTSTVHCIQKTLETIAFNSKLEDSFAHNIKQNDLDYVFSLLRLIVFFLHVLLNLDRVLDLREGKVVLAVSEKGNSWITIIDCAMIRFFKKLQIREWF